MADVNDLVERVAAAISAAARQDTGDACALATARARAAIRVVVECAAEVCDERVEDETTHARGAQGNMLFQCMAAADCASDLATAIRALAPEQSP